MARRSGKIPISERPDSDLWELVENYLDQHADWHRQRVKPGGDCELAREAARALETLYQRGRQLQLPVT